MAVRSAFRGPVAVLTGLLTATAALGEVNAHIPTTPNPATTSPSSYEINIGRPVKISVRMPQLLANACRTQAKISACTFFAEEKLDTRCGRNGEKWQLQASVHFVPVMYLKSPRFEDHEFEHVDHVTGMLRDHLDALVQLRFDSEPDCTSIAEKQLSGFPNLMNEFRRESNRKLH